MGYRTIPTTQPHAFQSDKILNVFRFFSELISTEESPFFVFVGGWGGGGEFLSWDNGREEPPRSTKKTKTGPYLYQGKNEKHGPIYQILSNEPMYILNQ